MGSGSTLIRLILDSHERIGIPQETGFMRAYQAHQFIPLKWSGRNWARRMGWSREELDQELAAFYDRIFSRYIESQGKARWGDKTPLHTWHVDGMARLYPDAQFIGMIRHPGPRKNSPTTVSTTAANSRVANSSTATLRWRASVAGLRSR